MAKKRAFVKYTKQGKIIPGSLIVTTSGGYPINGLYQEVPADLCCITTTTTTIAPITPTYRCSAYTDPFRSAYYAAEREWGQFPYQFELVSMVLNGVEFGSGQILDIPNYSDLVITNNLFGDPGFVQNINNWLNSIPGVANAGFVFYDNMQTIDMPDASSTYLIQIRRTIGQFPSPLDYYTFKTPMVTGFEFPTYTETPFNGPWTNCNPL